MEGNNYMMMQTKVRPETYARIQKIEKKTGISYYKLMQMFADTIVRYMDDRHNLTPEMEKAMAIFEHMEGWKDALNHADPSVEKVIGEATYYMFDESGQQKGCRAVHVTKPFFGNWSEDMNIQHILERTLCLLTPERYRRLRMLAAEMGCESQLELFDKLIDHFSREEDVEELRRLFEDADRSEFGRKPAEQPYKRKHHKDIYGNEFNFNNETTND